MVVLNETPVRTSRNFSINNLKLENVTIPEEIGTFENVTIQGKNLKIPRFTIVWTSMPLRCHLARSVRVTVVLTDQAVQRKRFLSTPLVPRLIHLLLLLLLLLFIWLSPGHPEYWD